MSRMQIGNLTLMDFVNLLMLGVPFFGLRYKNSQEFF